MSKVTGFVLSSGTLPPRRWIADRHTRRRALATIFKCLGLQETGDRLEILGRRRRIYGRLAKITDRYRAMQTASAASPGVPDAREHLGDIRKAAIKLKRLLGDRRVPVEGLLAGVPVAEILSNLIFLASRAEQAQARLPASRAGRDPDRPFLALVHALAELYEDETGKRAKPPSRDPGKGQYGGPMWRLVCAMFDLLGQPMAGRSEDALAQAIRRAMSGNGHNQGKNHEFRPLPGA